MPYGEHELRLVVGGVNGYLSFYKIYFMISIFDITVNILCYYIFVVLLLHRLFDEFVDTEKKEYFTQTHYYEVHSLCSQQTLYV